MIRFRKLWEILNQAFVNFSRNRIRWILLFIVRYPVFEGFYPAIFFLIYRRDGIGIFFLISLMTAHRIIILISFHFVYIYMRLFFNITKIKKIDHFLKFAFMEIMLMLFLFWCIFHFNKYWNIFFSTHNRVFQFFPIFFARSWSAVKLLFIKF